MASKSIEGFEGRYSIYDDGRVWSHLTNRFLRQKERGGNPKSRYLAVTLYKDAIESIFSVHRLVAKAFILNPENKPQTNHKDGNKKNNHISNLEWVTRSENQLHAFKTGLSGYVNSNKNGRLSNEGNGRSKVTLEMVKDMRLKHPTRKRGDKPYLEYGISNVQYYNIISGRCWKTVGV